MRDVPIKMRKIIVKFWKCCEIFARELIQFAVVSQNSVIILCAVLPRQCLGQVGILGGRSTVSRRGADFPSSVVSR